MLEFINIENRIDPFHFKFGEKKVLNKVLKALYIKYGTDIKEYKHYSFYDKIINWLSDDKGAGLALVRKDKSNNGVGKSLFFDKIYPHLLYHKQGKSAMLSINCLSISYSTLESILRIQGKRILFLDEFGRGPSVIKHYGTDYDVMETILGIAEKNKWKVLIASNYTIEQISEIYPTNHVADRIKSLCYIVGCSGESSRRIANKLFK